MTVLFSAVNVVVNIFIAIELYSDLFFFADVTSDLRNTNVLNILTKAT